MLTGIIRVEKLTENRGYVIIGIFVVAAILTPPDALSQCIMAVPMWLLYEAGVVTARIMLKMKRDSRRGHRQRGSRGELIPGPAECPAHRLPCN